MLTQQPAHIDNRKGHDMGSRKSGWIDNTEAMRWTPTQLAQVLAEVHYAVASRSDQLSMYNHPMFVATRANLRLGIEVAYPREFATWGPSLIEAAYSIWVNSGEPIEDAVKGAVKYLSDARDMRHAARVSDRVSAYVNAATQARGARAGYWLNHLAKHYPGLPETGAHGPSDLLRMILDGDTRCPCGSDHDGDKLAAERYEGPDASRAATPGAHSESAGIPTTQDQPASDPWSHAAPLNHERKRTDR